VERDKINLKSLFSNKISSLIKIEDFRFKCLLNYFRTENDLCQLCKKNTFDSLHLFISCPKIKQIEFDAFGNDEFSKSRIKFTKKHNKHHSIHAWISNWAIWLMRNEIVHAESAEKKNLLLSRAPITLRNSLKFHELAHLHCTQFKHQKMNEKRLQHFVFHSISVGKIITKHTAP